mgnify:CR=1 FL=1
MFPSDSTVSQSPTVFIPFMLQNVFQCFFVTAERPKLGLTVIVLAGVTNMILDFLFIAVFVFRVAHRATRKTDAVFLSVFV